MTKLFSTAIALTCLAFSQLSHAGLITFETKSLNGAVLTDDLKSSWQANSNQVTTRELDAFDLVDIGRNTIGHLNVEFYIAEQGFWTFDFGLDAGFGADLYVDGALAVSRTDDLWWTRNWQHGDVFSLDNFEFSQGNHSIDLFFAENCCDGLSTIRLTNHATQEVSVLSSQSLPTASVPEPDTRALFALGALGLIMRRKKK